MKVDMYCTAQYKDVRTFEGVRCECQFRSKVVALAIIATPDMGGAGDIWRVGVETLWKFAVGLNEG